MPALDLALGLRMIGRATNMRDIPLVEPFRKFAGYVAGPVVTEQTRFMDNPRLIEA